MKNKCLKTVALALVLAMAACMFGGCASSKNSSAGSDEQELLSKVTESGKLVVCMNITEPWNYIDPTTGEYTGMGIELVEGFADSLGIEVEYMPLEFASLIPTIEDGKADMLVTNLTRTVARASSKILYTEPVGGAQIVAVVQKGSYSSVDELNQAGITLTTEAATISEEIAPDCFPNATMSPCNTNADAIAALKAGRADAFITDTNVAEAVIAADDSLEYINEPVFLDTYAFGVKLSYTSYTFVEAFNLYLRLAKLDGTYGALYEKYFGVKWVPNSTEIAM